MDRFFFVIFLKNPTMKNIFTAFLCLYCLALFSQSPLYDIIENVSADRLQKDIQTLVGFGTRHTLSDTLSETRGIGAARRWIKAEFESISKNCNNCLEVFYQKNYCP